MRNYFDMAYRDDTSALQLHIKVNSENLLPIPQKYNGGSLRVPADPSWPKIPRRKSINDTIDILEPPYVVTLKGSPRRSHTVVRTPLNQSIKPTKDTYSSFCNQKTAASMHTLKRLPGCVDPRFKKVTNTKRNHVTSADSSEQECDALKKLGHPDCAVFPNIEEGEKSIPERDFNKQQVTTQEAEKPDEARMIQSVKTEFSKTICEAESYLKMDRMVQDHQEHNNSALNGEVKTSEDECVANDKGNNNVVDAFENAACKDGMTEKDGFVKRPNCCQHSVGLKPSATDGNTEEKITALPTKESNPQLFFVVEKKLQSQPVNSIQVDAIAIPQDCTKQCYNVQLPILTYQNIPVQISAEGRCNVLQQCMNNTKLHDVPKESTYLNGVKDSIKCSVDSPGLESWSKKIEQGVLSQVQSFVDEDLSYGNKKLCVEEPSVLSKDKKNESQVQCASRGKEKSHKSNTSNANPNIPEKLEATQRKRQESSDSEYYFPTAVKKSIYNNSYQNSKLKKITYITDSDTTDSEFVVTKDTEKGKSFNLDSFSKTIKKTTKNTTQNGTTAFAKDNDTAQKVNPLSKKENKFFQQMPELNSTLINRERSTPEYKTWIYEGKLRNKSEEHFSCGKSVHKKLLRNSEPHLPIKERKGSTKLSRRARSYFQRNSHSALMDSDYTLTLPNCKYNKCKRNTQNVQKLSKAKRIGHHSNSKLSARGWNKGVRIMNGSNRVEGPETKNIQDTDLSREIVNSVSETYLPKEHFKQDVSPRTNTEDVFEKPKSIPLKTQELLNKSYWDYYNKLKHEIKNTGNVQQQYLCQLTMGAPEIKKRRADEGYDKDLNDQGKLNPELRTLRQCSALSTMINKALDSSLQESDTMQTKELYLNGNTKSSTEPTAVTQSGKKVTPNLGDRRDTTPMFINKMKRKREKRDDKKFLELKTIIFFGSMMYILIIFLPMLYDYLYQDEYDDYENVSYMELIFDYILSSFNEAFGGFYESAKKIFFYPVRSREKHV